MRIFGVDPGSARTGYGCIETDGSRHRVVVSGVLSVPARTPFPDKLQSIHTRLCELLARHEPGAVAVEDLFHAKNVRSAIKLGQVKGAVLLAGEPGRVAGDGVHTHAGEAGGGRIRRRREGAGTARW